MSEEDSEKWTAGRKASQGKRARNREYSTKAIQDWIEENGEVLMTFSESHLRICERFDFWPGTGKWLDRVTGKYDRGVYKLLARLDDYLNERIA